MITDVATKYFKTGRKPFPFHVLPMQSLFTSYTQVGWGKHCKLRQDFVHFTLLREMIIHLTLYLLTTKKVKMI